MSVSICLLGWFFFLVAGLCLNGLRGCMEVHRYVPCLSDLKGNFLSCPWHKDLESFLTLWSTVFADVPFAASWRELLRAERHVPPELWLRKGDRSGGKELVQGFMLKQWTSNDDAADALFVRQPVQFIAKNCLDRHPPDHLLFCVSVIPVFSLPNLKNYFRSLQASCHHYRIVSCC